MVRMCWRRHLLQVIIPCWGHLLKCGGLVLSWDNDLVRMCWRRHLLQGIWPCWGHWLKCGGVGVVLGQ